MKKKIILNKIAEIEAEMRNSLPANISLLGGAMGHALFYSCLFDLTKEQKHLEKCQSLIQYVIDRFTESSLPHTFASGYAGIAWGINFLKGKEILEFDMDYLFGEIEDFIYESSRAELKNGRYDFLHGGMSAAIYALSRLPNKAARQYLEDCVLELDRLKIVDEKGYKWEDTLKEKGESDKPYRLYNLGLSHGMPSILNILLRIYKRGIQKGRTKKLIAGCAEWIVNSAAQHKKELAIHPACVFDQPHSYDESSRLSWCYGDLGIAWTLLKAGEIMEYQPWENHGRLLIENSLSRLDPLESATLDAAFCHGTAGIAYLFGKFYRLTGIRACKRRHDFWIDETLKLAKYDDGLAGFKSYHLIHPDRWIRDYSLLEGISGIGIVLVNSLTETADWDECLLLTI